MINQEFEAMKDRVAAYQNLLTLLEAELFESRKHRQGICTRDQKPFPDDMSGEIMGIRHSDPCIRCGFSGYLSYDHMAGLEKRVKEGRVKTNGAKKMLATLYMNGLQLSFSEEKEGGA